MKIYNLGLLKYFFAQFFNKVMLFSIACSLIMSLSVTIFCTTRSDADAVDPAKILGLKACIECHSHEVQKPAWEKSVHFKTFRELPRSDKSKEMCEKLGIRMIRRDPLCQSCHFTVKLVRGKPRAILGISCESCHGAARDWIDIHNKISESKNPEEKEKNMAESEKNGMILPRRSIYQAAKECFECHIVREEKLVNGVGHPAGSDIELVAWTLGEVRHNLLYTEGKENAEESTELKRVMYVVGRMLDLEFSLRGLAMATTNGNYVDAMEKRLKNARIKIIEIDEKMSIEEVKTTLDVIDSVELKSDNESTLIKVADKIADAAQKFSKGRDGTKLGAIDVLVPGKEKYKGEVYDPKKGG